MKGECHFCGMFRMDLAWMVSFGNTVVLLCPNKCDRIDTRWLRARSEPYIMPPVRANKSQ